MVKTKRIRKTKGYRKTKRVKKTKGLRKTKKTLKRGGGNVPFSDIIEDIQKLPKEEFKEKYINNNAIYTIFDRKYRNAYKCWGRLSGDVKMLSKLWRARQGKTDDYKHNLYEVDKIIIFYVNRCIDDVDMIDYDGTLYNPIDVSQKNLKFYITHLEKELGINDVAEVPGAEVPGAEVPVDEVPVVEEVPLEEEEE